MGRQIGRRTFLKKAAAVTGAGIALPYFVRPSALGAAGTTPPSERITLGMIGTGQHGREMNIRMFLTYSDAQILAVCDVDPEQKEMAREMVNGKYENKDCTVCSDFREVLARNDIDAVMISTPDHWHVPIA
ncbi:MAG: Gfo/Idh/MocA family oxidoreductase, partial [Sedimentisphaerales bacterium]|nr:Gfo/Idh/MocA family oxidoreductase [Sedimentisphaerales bacterium]